MRIVDIRFSVRLMAITILCALGLGIFLFVSVNRLYSTLLEEKKAKTKEHIEVALSIIDGFRKQAASGALSQDQARQAAEDALRSARYADNQYFWINDMDGRMLMHPTNSQLVGTSILELKSATGNRIFADMIDVVRRQGSGFYSYLWKLPTDAEPRPKLSYVAGVAEWNWVIGTGVYIDDINALFRQQMLVLGGIAIGILVVVTLAGQMIVRGIVRPLGRLVAEMDELANGHLDRADFGVDRRDEIGDLGRSLQVFRRNAREMERLRQDHDAQQRKAEVTRKETMTSVANQFESSVGSVVQAVASAANQMQSASGTMAQSAQRASDEAASVSQASQQASSNVQTVASATEELSASIEEIARQMARSQAVAERAGEAAGRTNDLMQALNDSVGRIGTVVGLINDIAGQTNLLALNATIEAARAGDAGKGFAVVAGEVKTLANQTGKATGDIAQQIAEVQDKTTQAVGAIASIAAVIREMTEISGSVAAAVQQQSAATGEIARNVEQASSGTEEVSSSIGRVERAARESGATAEQVRTSAQDLSRQADILSREVERFLGQVRA
jgi:methyl-accepting chemotaxis protein